MSNLVKMRLLFRFGLVFICLLLQACVNITPTGIRESAASLPRGVVQVSTAMDPRTASVGKVLSLSYGLTNRLDVGVDLEYISNLWTRYSLLNNPHGTSLALVGGVFQAKIDALDDGADNDRRERLKGVYLGGILSQSVNERITVNFGYRYNSLHYDAFEMPGTFILDESMPFYDGRLRDSVFISEQDLEGIGFLSATVSYSLKSANVTLHLGGACQLFHTVDNPELKSSDCAPALGVTFFRR